VSRESAEARLPAALDEAKAATKRFADALVPAPLEHDWGFPHQGRKDARARVSQCAGWGGWSDERVQKALARNNEAEARWQAAVRKSIDAERGKLPAPNKLVSLPGGWRARVLSSGCDVAKKRKHAGHDQDSKSYLRTPCFVRVKLKNNTNQAYDEELTRFGRLASFQLVRADGSGMDLKLASATLADGAVVPPSGARSGKRPRLSVAPGESVKILLHNGFDKLPIDPSEVSVEQQSGLIRMRQGETAVLLRIR
jgi:hypothetical protein